MPKSRLGGGLFPILLITSLAICFDPLCIRGTAVLPSGIDEWNIRESDGLKQEGVSRLWDRDDLRQASKILNYDQMRPLLDKLHSGQAVTVLALGDSITQHGGGCFHRDAEHMQHTVHTLGVAFEVCEGYGLPPGWLSTFMHTLNSTWPHPDHILVNLGVPGSSFHSFAHDVCIESLSPGSADLLVLEHLPFLEPSDTLDLTAHSIEVLMQRLQLKLNCTHTLPPVLLLNMHQLADFGQPAFDRINHCILHPKASCAADCPDAFSGLPAASSEDSAAETDTDAVAAHYGMASFSYTRLLRRIVGKRQDDTLQAGAGDGGGGGAQSGCTVLRSLFIDTMHPSALGQLLLADLLVEYLAAAEAHLLSSNDPRGSLHPVDRPHLHLDRRRIPIMRCYGARGQHRTAAPGDVRPPEEMDVVKSDGWSHVQVEHSKYKPGWVATQPGSALWIALDVGLAGGAKLAHGFSTIQLLFLKSYERMGKAAVSCVSGCHCETTLFDGHNANHHFSEPVPLEFSVTELVAHKACVVQVLVLPETDSGEHKVKVLQVAVKMWMDLSKFGRFRHSGSQNATR